MKLKTYTTIFGTLAKLIPPSIKDKMHKTCFYERPDYLPKGLADIAFVFGAENDHWRIERAAELYHSGKVKKVLISGGVSPFNIDQSNPESDFLASVALDLGIKANDLIVEKGARSSLENVSLSLKLLHEMGYDTNQLSYVVVTSDFHQRRCVNILKNALADGSRIYHAAAEHPVAARDKWRKTNYGRFLILKEVFQLKRLQKKAR